MRGVLGFVLMSGSVAAFKQGVPLLHFYSCLNVPFCSRYESFGFFSTCCSYISNMNADISGSICDAAI